MAPQSNSTMLDALFGSRRDFLCSHGIDYQQYQCHQYQLPASMPTIPSMPSCAQENIGDFQNRNYNVAPTMPSCSPKHQNLPPVTKKKKYNRRVTFIAQDSVREIPNLQTYTRREINDMYMSRDEMNRSHEECWRLVDLMNSGIEYEDHDQFSKRGLIDLKDDSVDRRRKIRDQTYQIVLGVQQFQKSNNAHPCMDVVEIAAGLYHKAAQQAREEAIEAAWFDAVAVRM